MKKRRNRRLAQSISAILAFGSVIALFCSSFAQSPFDTSGIARYSYMISGFKELNPTPLAPDSTDPDPLKGYRGVSAVAHMSNVADQTGVIGIGVFLDSVAIHMPGWPEEYAKVNRHRSFHLFFDTSGERFIGAVGQKPNVRHEPLSLVATQSLDLSRYMCILGEMNYSICDSIPQTPMINAFPAAVGGSRVLATDQVFVAFVNYTYSDTVPRPGWFMVSEYFHDYVEPDLSQVRGLTGLSSARCRLTLIDDATNKALFVRSCPDCYWQLREEAERKSGSRE